MGETKQLQSKYRNTEVPAFRIVLAPPTSVPCGLTVLQEQTEITEIQKNGAGRRAIDKGF